ncbi:MAG: hypothetical protein GX085_05965 [Firmicutes bacterium]|nr:hypothetical protein [Bacillota bacterium]
MITKRQLRIDPEICSECGICQTVCNRRVRD